jgi:hypothetical protein
MATKQKTQSAPATQEAPASQAPVKSIADALGAAESIPDNVRGQEKKKRNAVRKSFRSASNKLLMEAAGLLGLVKNTWMSGDIRCISVDVKKFDAKGFLPEDVGLFLGFRDAIEAAGVTVSSFVIYESGYIGVHAHRKDVAEVA